MSSASDDEYEGTNQRCNSNEPEDLVQRKGPATPVSLHSQDSSILSPGPKSPEESQESKSPRSRSWYSDGRKGPRSPPNDSQDSRSPDGPTSPTGFRGPRSPDSRGSNSPEVSRRPRTPDSRTSKSPQLSRRSPESRDSKSPEESRRPRSPDSRGSKSPKIFRGPMSPDSQDAHESQGPKSPEDSKDPRNTSRSPQRDLSPERLASSFGDSRLVPKSPLSPRHKNQHDEDENDDDGRSDISSGSSLLSQEDKEEEVKVEEKMVKDNLNNKPQGSPKRHISSVPDADDLSDVSDLEESYGLQADDSKEEEEEKKTDKPVNEQPNDKPSARRNSLNIDDDGEQLDFEAEDQLEVEKEDGEIETGANSTSNDKKTNNDDKSDDEGELKEDDDSLEEGEVTDEGDPKPEKPPVCRFFSRGACTWGANCRFLHPGVTDKGNYTMFDIGRPMVASSMGPGMYPSERPPYGAMIARLPPNPYGPLPIRREDPLVESAWERGLRQAKEMMRKSTKRKETDMDFEEKKMNLSIGQDEIDKENDYYTRAASPVDEPNAYGRLSPRLEGDVRRPVRVVESYEDIMPDPMSPRYASDYKRHYELAARRGERPAKYYEEEYALKKGRKEKMVREVIVQRVEKDAKRRPDDWSDPWMRSKSPSRKTGHKPRRPSYSSGSSSLSSRSKSRSSSNSSYSSSYSRSRSRSLSRSRSPRVRRPPTAPVVAVKKKPSPTDPKFKPVRTLVPEKKTMLMNPPAPTPKRIKEKPMSPSVMRKVGLNPPPPSVPKTKIPKHSAKVKNRKSKSSSASSGSSSDSSKSTYSSSSSSSRGVTPPVSRPVKAPRKIEINERLAAQAAKGKAMDALKVSGQKPQIKLTLKPTDNIVVGKKRPAEEPLTVDTAKSPSAAKPQTPKKPASRREELLKQLKAVEDAIARKRSKI